MKRHGWKRKSHKIPDLSPERAEEILRNVFQAVGMEPPKNCSEILRKGTEGKGGPPK